MTTLRKIADWSRYERLHHYPALAAFDRDAALRRLEAYERERCQPWLTVVWVLIVVFGLLWTVMEYFSAARRPFMIVIQIPFWVLQYVMYRSEERRVGKECRSRWGACS